MTGYGFCPTCRTWHRSDGACPPQWDVWVPDSGEDREDAVRVYAYDADLAARKWAEDDDAMSADYSIVGGTPATVGVAATGSAKVEWREVSGESVPEYRSREVEKP